MQRKLLAVAVAGAFALPSAALAQVTISGSFRYSMDNWSHNDGSVAGSGVNKWGLQSHSSNIKFTVRENLGGGMSGWGVLEAGLDDTRKNAQNALWNGRNSGMGIDGAWGTFMIGLWDSPYKQLDGAWSIGSPAAYSQGPTAPIFGNGDTTGSHPNPNCGVNESGAGWTITSVSVASATATIAAGNITSIATVCMNSAGSATSFQRRLGNTFQWWSPVWNGVQLLVGTMLNEEKTRTFGSTVSYNPALWAAALRWTGPRWAVVFGHERHKDYNKGSAAAVAAGNRGSTDRAWKVGGNYNFGPVQLGLAYERLTYDLGTVALPTNLRHSNWSVGLAIPVGSGAVRGQYSRSSVSGSAEPATGADGNLWNLSYEYNLSKRTAVYIAYAKLTQQAGSARQYGNAVAGPLGINTANQAGADPRTLSFGMNHNF